MPKRSQNSILHFFGKKQCINADLSPTVKSCSSKNQHENNSTVSNEVSILSTLSSASFISNYECGYSTPNMSQSISEPHPYDIGLFAGKDITNEEKLNILSNMWIPNSEFVFPAKGKRNLRFQHKWIYRWTWLAYSDFQGGAFCKFCLLFAPSAGVGSGKQALGQLCKTKFENWKDAVERFSEHEKCHYHKQSMETASVLGDIQCGKKISISAQIDSASMRKKLENRKNITPIIETVLFCGKQGLALRGHRDSGRIGCEVNSEENDGNFRALLRFRSNTDATLKNMLESSHGNAQYISPRIQNEIIESSNELILHKLVKEVNSSSCFSIVADETADIGGVEQLSLCVRYVDRENFFVKENFLQFIPVYDMTGKGIAAEIINFLRLIHIDIQKLRGQGYDGAASMCGKLNGVQAHIKEIIPSALYVHCSAHSLNLAVSSACEVSTIRNCMGTISSLYDFLNTPKRQHALSSVIHEMDTTTSRREKLKQLCATRWLERYDSVAAVVELYDPIVETLQKISEWKDKESSTQANSLLFAITNCQFVIALFCIHKVFSLSMHLCRFLQKSSIDLAEGMNLAEDISNEIKSWRENVNEEFKAIFVSASGVLEMLGISITVPRMTERQSNRLNLPSAMPETYYRVSIFIPFLDAFISQLDLRFLRHKEILKGFQCLFLKPDDSPILLPSKLQSFRALTEFYNSDVSGSPESLTSELKLWHKRIMRQDKVKLPKTAIEALQLCNPNITPNIFQLLEILAVLPVSTCTNERSFSTLRHLKTYLRNSTGSTRLNGLALLNIHRSCTPNVEDVLTELAKKPRRLDIAL